MAYVVTENLSLSFVESKGFVPDQLLPEHLEANTILSGRQLRKGYLFFSPVMVENEGPLLGTRKDYNGAAQVCLGAPIVFLSLPPEMSVQ